jgi:chaperonin cofactor prefoldin
MPRKEYDIQQQKQLLKVQISELQHLPQQRQVFRSMGAVLMPADKDELLDNLLGEHQKLELQSATRK